MTDAVHIVLDETAMTAAGAGNPLVSRLIHRAHSEPGWHIYAPACALVEADRARPGTAEHLAGLPGLTVIDLDLAAVLALAQQATWAHAHAQHTAQPTADRPEGAVIATTTPERWKGEPVRVLDLTP
ncbi:hypothetical protein ACFY9F_36260 [Streptomyces sp. NPDC012421]|uniref:hypothetical protein n=1 Tax=Streptomyces sp. NPDC012421 TaxID=3364832 RepID=UPI0036EB9255